MRIQHNIMAMNAYRNYNNNTSSLSKNLEKLSSGYKINRAGDDAAGLAISEKMRAQITGLNAAQKNVKDGISLVKTAEGAMQEIQDMLNRMDYLATQSANGTYDNEVDRANLQKEVDALKTEINRIADSANFNGIKLLDGSLDSKAVAASTSTGAGKLPAVGEILGKDTVLHKDGAGTDSDNTFSVDLHNLSVSGKKGQEFTISIGDTTLIGTLQDNAEGDDALTATDVADALRGTDTKIKFRYDDADETAYTTAGDGAKFGEATFTVSGQGTRVTFTQNNDEDFDPELKVSVSAGDATSTKVGKATVTDGKDAVEAEYTTKSKATANTLANSKTGNQYTVTVGSKGIDVTTTADGEDRAALLTKWAAAFSETGFTVAVNGDDIVVTKTGATGGTAAAETDFTGIGFAAGGTVNDDGANTTYTLAGAAKAFKDAAGNTGIVDKTGVDNKYDVTLDGKKYEVTSTLAATTDQVADAWATAANADTNLNDVFTATAQTDGSVKFVADIDTDNPAPEKAVLTDNGFTVTNANWKEGSEVTSATSVIDFAGKTGKKVMGGTITVGDKTYEFVKDEADKSEAGNIAVVITEEDTAEDLAQALADASGTGTGVPTNTQGGVAAGTKVTFTSDNAGEGNTADVATTITKGGGDPTISGDYNVSSTVVAKKSEAGKDRLASTYFNLTKDMASDTSTITIGREKYTFTTDKANKDKAGMVYVGDLDLSKKEDMVEAADRLTKAAENNSTYTVGHDGTRMTFTENEGQTDFEDKEALDSLKNIEKSFGFEIAGKAADEGRSLTLQIGDTSDDFNQMKVKVGDMHTAAMGIADIDISSQDGAAAAVQTIKDAINYVSGVRGDLGAIQNRLEHTQNNLSVMAENIQDAESTIRDTDVAEEMMSYVKNNILVQSAQAMLAQANQVPQGVLQLLG